jgi:tetratricopeptide (TPR) repeat protein
LSVFRGGFSLENAERLVGDSDSVLDGISSLIDKAFLRRDPASRDEDPRFVMLETIREYGLEVPRRAGPRSRSEARTRESDGGIAEENELEVERLQTDEDNFRTAIEWATQTGDAELALRLGAALWWSWYVRGQYAEGRRCARDDSRGAGRRQRAGSRESDQTGAGALAFLQCDYEHAITLLESSIDLARAHGDPMSLARSLQFRGSIARERGEYEHAIDLHLLSRTIWAELEDRANVGRTLNYVGFASWLNAISRARSSCAKKRCSSSASAAIPRAWRGRC